MRVLYLTHDLDDPATWRRVSMLETGGADVAVVGFRRGDKPLDRAATVLGQTRNGRFLHRAASALTVLLRAGAVVGNRAPDVILARNLEMLPLARRIRNQVTKDHPPRLVYEVLDIHRLLVGPGRVPSLMRRIERWLCRDVDQVLLSSTRFEMEHFLRHGQTAAPSVLVENKVWDPAMPDPVPRPLRAPRSDGGPIVIGWFGVLRCAASLRCLDAICRQAEGRVKLVLRGRPARDALPDLDRTVRENPHIEFHGAYAYPDDLPAIYGAIDIAWLVDRFDAGANSDWLLPNRLYESCAFGAVPLGLAGTETGRYLSRHDLGPVLQSLDPDDALQLLTGLDQSRLAALQARIAALGTAQWRTTRQDCVRLVEQLAGLPGAYPAKAAAPRLDPAESVG